MDSLRKIKVFFNSTSFCNVSPAAHAQIPHALKRMQMTGHSSRCKNKLPMNGKHMFLRGCFDLQCVCVCVCCGCTMTQRIHSSSSWESFSISQELHGIFSATTNSKLVLFNLLAWISLQKETTLWAAPSRCSLTSHAYLLMDGWDSRASYGRSFSQWCDHFIRADTV